jgi:hypothetical protein
MLKSPKKTQSTALLAFGSASGWNVSIDEALAGHEQWTLEIDSARIYLRFTIDRLAIIEEAIAFLESGLTATTAQAQASLGEIKLGKWGAASIHLIWDSEGFPRCVLLVGPHRDSVMRFVLLESEIQALLEGLKQVAADLKDT